MQLTVMVYFKLEFHGEWEFNYDEFAYTPVTEEAELVVVTEDGTGGYHTHWFKVRRAEKFGIETVIVPREENIVYIPALCLRRESGDLTECREG